ncbi:hypothetical protein HQ533_01385 [Candidatus Woesearchaeota archaeon]|nr:hypothetical protein [Candidatus Woesearchaeota archaeon]
MHRKAQMEIMGLIVIVILLVLGMVFMVTLQTNRPKNEIKTSYEDDQLASNFIISFLKTNSECRGYTMEELIQDCATGDRLGCGGSCKYLNQTLHDTISKTLDVWGKKYRFEINMPNSNIVFNSSCDADDEKDSAFQPISLYPQTGTVVLKLDICE